MNWNYVDISGIRVEHPSSPSILPSLSPVARRTLQAVDSAYLLEAGIERFGRGSWYQPEYATASVVMNHLIPTEVHARMKAENASSGRNWVDGDKREEERTGTEGGNPPSYGDIFGVGTLTTTDAEISAMAVPGALDPPAYMHLYQDLSRFRFRAWNPQFDDSQLVRRHSTSGAPDAGVVYAWLKEDRQGHSDYWLDTVYCTTGGEGEWPPNFTLSDLSPYFPTQTSIRQWSARCIMDYRVALTTYDSMGIAVGSRSIHATKVFESSYPVDAIGRRWMCPGQAYAQNSVQQVVESVFPGHGTASDCPDVPPTHGKIVLTVEASPIADCFTAEMAWNTDLSQYF